MTRVDDGQANCVYKMAAEKGDIGSQNTLSERLLKAPDQESKEAGARWISEAAKQGNSFAEWKMGYLYLNGIGVPNDRAEAMRWYTLSAQHGNKDAWDVLLQNHIAVDRRGLAELDSRRLIQEVARRGCTPDDGKLQIATMDAYRQG